MPTRSSRRLAGCIVIDLLLAPGWFAAGFEYQAGTASFEKAKALVVQDRRGHRAVIGQAEFGVTRAVSDFVGARLLQKYEVDRAGVLVRGSVLVRGLPTGLAQPEDLVTAIGVALGRLEPAVIRFHEGTMSVTTRDGRCLATFTPELAFDHCVGGDLVRGAIRAAFQMVEPEHGLLQRNAVPLSYPVQVIAIGKQVTILGLGGAVSPAGFQSPGFQSKGLIVAPFSNDSGTPPADVVVQSAVRQVMKRIR